MGHEAIAVFFRKGQVAIFCQLLKIDAALGVAFAFLSPILINPPIPAPSYVSLARGIGGNKTRMYRPDVPPSPHDPPAGLARREHPCYNSYVQH